MKAIYLKNNQMSLRIEPKKGMNVESICYQNQEYIYQDSERKLSGANYGTPILFPTPNRVKNNEFKYENLSISAKMHGFIRNFDLSESIVEVVEDRVTWKITSKKGNHIFQEFPFLYEMVCEIALCDTTIKWSYTIRNTGEVRLPYSFALHPFFVRELDTCYCLKATHQMEADLEKYPTGNLLPLDSNNVSTWQNPNDICLDHVFVTAGNPMAQLVYPNRKTRVEISASNAFTRCVVYTPSKEAWFCIEPQTSSVDCHNMYDAGKVEAANLQLIPTEKYVKEWISFSFA